MRKNLLALIAILFSILSQAQWSVQVSNVTTELRSVYFVDGQTGYVVGAPVTVGVTPATVLKTTDGGQNWTSIIPPFNDVLRAVHFLDASTGITCGALGMILRTTDGGNTWDTIPSGSVQLLRSIHFPTHDVGYICGGLGVILKTIDAGLTWTDVSSVFNSDLINIRFEDQDRGYAVSSNATFLSGFVLKTINGGITWDTAYSDAQGLLGVGVINAQRAFAGGGNQTIVRTLDGGVSWDLVYTGTAATNLRSAAFTSNTDGFFVGDLGSLLGTTNGGTTWTQYPVTTNGLLGVHFPYTDTGYAVGNIGTIIKYIAPCPLVAALGSISGPIDMCEGDTGIYSVDSVYNATTYSWSVSGNAQILSGQGSTTIIVYSGNSSGDVSVTGFNVCDSSNTSSLNFQVHSLPPVPIVTFLNNVLYSSNNTDSLQWYLDGNVVPGATSAVYNPPQNGVYLLEVINEFGCSSFSDPENVVLISIQELTSNENVLIAPNPFHGSTTINFQGNSISTLTIMNLEGKIIFQKENVKQPIAVSLVPGIYLYQFSSADNEVKARGKLVAQ